jgi:hypothetical protein
MILDNETTDPDKQTNRQTDEQTKVFFAPFPTPTRRSSSASTNVEARLRKRTY